MRIQLSSIVSIGNIHGGEVADADDLDIILRLEEVNSLQRAFGNCAGATRGVETVCNDIPFASTDRSLGRWSPETEIVDRANASTLVKI